MTKAAAPVENPSRTVEIKDVLDHQRADDEAPQRFKVWRHGRRRGKSVGEIKASFAGHGPIDAKGMPLHEGVVHGWAVAWLAPDFQQAKNLWNAEIRERFLDKDGVKLTNQPPFAVEILDNEGKVYGGLYIYSFENVRAMRGLGNRLKGVVFEEAAHFDLAYAWGDVVRPMLMDNKGWAIFGSTTNAGLDGNQDKVAPSFFNRLCVEVMSGERPADEWRHSHGTARDNPKISPEEFEAARAEVAKKGAVAVAQEMEAELLTAGAGIAFPEWHAAYHVLPRSVAIPSDWPLFAGLDWGYNDPGLFTLLVAAPERSVMVRVDWLFRQMTAYDVGCGIGQLCRRHGIPEFIAYDSSMDDTYRLGGYAASFELMRGLAETLTRACPPMIPTVKEGRGGKSYRQARKILLHEMLSFTEPGCDAEGKPREIQPWQRPRLTFHPDAVNCIATIPVLPLDPKDPEDVDTTANDHPYDSLTYALMGQMPKVREAKPVPDRDRLYLNERGLPTGAGLYAPPPLAQSPVRFRFTRGEKREESV